MFDDFLGGGAMSFGFNHKDTQGGIKLLFVYVVQLLVVKGFEAIDQPA